MPDADRDPAMPPHVTDAVQAIARLHADHYGTASRVQRWIDRATAHAGRPYFVLLLAAVVLGWTALNETVGLAGRVPVDPPPFVWMQGVIGLSALLMTVLILATQRREDELATRREQLTLELAILSEQKAAKIIELLETLRRDLSGAPNRDDPQATILSKPADPEAVLDAIRDTHEAIEGSFASTAKAAKPD